MSETQKVAFKLILDEILIRLWAAGFWATGEIVGNEIVISTPRVGNCQHFGFALNTPGEHSRLAIPDCVQTWIDSWSDAIICRERSDFESWRNKQLAALSPGRSVAGRPGSVTQ